MYSRPSVPSKCRLNYLDYFERILPLPFDIIFMGACPAGRPPCPSSPLYLGRAATVEPGWARPGQQWNNTTAAELRRLMRAWTAGWPRGCSSVISNIDFRQRMSLFPLFRADDLIGKVGLPRLMQLYRAQMTGKLCS